MLKLREATRKQLTLQQLLFSKMEVAEQFTMGQQLQQALLSCSAEVDRAGLTMAEATDLLDFEKAEAVPANSLTYKIDKYDKVSSLAEPVTVVCKRMVVAVCMSCGL